MSRPSSTSSPNPGRSPAPAVAPPVSAEDASPTVFGLPIWQWVLIAVAAAVPIGLFLSQDAHMADAWPTLVRRALSALVATLDLLPTLILRALTALAAPLVVLAILSAIVTNEIHGRQGLRMMVYYLINTLVAMTIGLALTNLIHPGRQAPDEPGLSATSPAATATRSGVPVAISAEADRPQRLIDALSGSPPVARKLPEKRTARDLITEIVPRNLFESLLQNHLAQLVLFTLAAAIALSKIRDEQRSRGESAYLAVENLLTVGFELLMRILLWVVSLVPLAVFGVVATSLAREGFVLVQDLFLFIVTVLLGLGLQFLWYLGQLGVFARMSPRRFLQGAADVLATTFSTASTTATMPVTLRCLQGKLGVSRQSSQLAACVGTNFNNDGTALYQAVAALYFAQTQGMALDFGQQLIIVATTLLASVGAGGIPSGSFVTMPLILAAVNLSPDRLPILLTIDWFLDRCRTSSNVVGDMTVAILLDRTLPGEKEAPEGEPSTTA